MKSFSVLGRSVLANLLLVCCSATSFAAPIYVDAAPGLATLEPAWDLSIFQLRLDVESNTLIDEVKALINQAAPSITISHQVLSFAGKELLGFRTLADYNIQKDSILSLTSNNISTVSEPITLALVGFGLTSLGLSRRKKTSFTKQAR